KERERERQPLALGSTSKGVTPWLVMVHDYARCRSSHSGQRMRIRNRRDLALYGTMRCSAVQCGALIGWMNVGREDERGVRTSNSKSKPESYILHPISVHRTHIDSNADTAVVDAVSELNKVLPSPNELTLGENQSSIWLPSLVANG
ncbi:hypothetical protein ALC62_10344, partial [Cyphomyrmex costatus]